MGEEFPTGIPLCRAHYLSLLGHLGNTPPLVQVVKVSTAGYAVVYYVGDPPTQLIKIGTTTRLGVRLPALRKRWPALVLLATEPGHFELEKARHAEFAHLRVKVRAQTEWFRKDARLMEHVNWVRQEFGDPAAVPAADLSAVGGKGVARRREGVTDELVR